MGSNVALVVLDSLRYDKFQNSFDWLPGKEYTAAYATSHWTIPTHASMFTGQYPSEVGVHGKSPTLDCSEPTLAETLSEAGYRTQFYSANTNVTHWKGWGRGFDEVVEFARLDPRNEGLIDWSEFARENTDSGLSRVVRAVAHCLKADCPTIPAIRQGLRYRQRSRADGGTDAALRRVKATEFDSEDEFLMVNLMETHTPYHTPDEGGPVNVTIGDAFADAVDDPERIRAGYAESVSYLSRTYEELYSVLEDEFEYIITVGDHGEMLGEHGMWNHGYGLYPELVRVPLVISGDDVSEEPHDDIVSILDVHKTVADLAGVSIDSRGRNLLRSPAEKPLLTEYHGFLPFHKDQFDRKGVNEDVYHEHDSRLSGIVLPEGYAYGTHADGLCTDDGIDLDETKTEIEELRESISERETEAFEYEIDEETKQQLRDLGYA